MAFIETLDLWQRRDGRDILKGINLRVDRGEVFAFIGPTGAGKTTLLRLIDLLDAPAAGKIIFAGADMSAAPEKTRLEARRRIAFVLQKPLVFNMSVYDNIACGLKWRGVGGGERRQRVNRILETVGLAAYGQRGARTLSGGEMQRVAIARAIATEPEVLLLDEPSANLDPVSAARIEDLISGVIRRDAITVIMATHDMAQGQRLADRIGVLVDGAIVQTGDPREIFNRPKNREVAEFVGMENILDGVVTSCEGEMAVVDVKGRHIEGVADCDAGQEVAACLRPEDVTVALAPVSSSARNCLEGTVVRTVITGPVCRVEIDCGFPLVALVTRRSADEMGLKKGRQVYATFKAVNVHIITQR